MNFPVGSVCLNHRTKQVAVGAAPRLAVMTNNQPWWEDFAALPYPPNFLVDSDSAEFPLPQRLTGLVDLPSDLPNLLAAAVQCNAAGDYAGAWRVMSEVARAHWFDEPDLTELPQKSVIDWFQLRIAATDFLELDGEREQIQAEWLAWAERNLGPRNEMLALAYRAISEIQSDASTIGDIMFPLTLDFVNKLEDMAESKQPLVGSAAIVLAEGCLGRGLAGLAESIAAQVQKLDPEGSNTDAHKLLRAHLAWHHGHTARAEDLLTQVEYQPVNNALTSTFEAHNLHAYLEFNRDNHAAALAHVRAAATMALDNDFVVAGFGPAAMYVKYLHDAGDMEAAIDFGRRYLRAAYGLPVSTLQLDLQLLVANALFMVGDFSEAADAAMAVATWSQMTDEDSRTTLAFVIAAENRLINDDIDGAIALMKDNADFMRSRGSTENWSLALRHAVRFAALSPHEPVRDRAILWLDETAPTSEEDRAMWLMLRFHLLMGAEAESGSSRADIADMEESVRIFSDHGEFEEAAKACVLALQYLVAHDRMHEAERYYDQVKTFVSIWNVDPDLLDIADEIMDQG